MHPPIPPCPKSELDETFSSILVRPMKSTILAIYIVAALSPCLFADAPKIRITVDAEADDGTSGKMVSLLSGEFRKLDGVLITDAQPEFRISCVLAPIARDRNLGYAASVAVVDSNNHLVTHLVRIDSTLEKLAHEITLAIDGTVLEQIRRTTSAITPP
jgi:hypothetical protein